MGPPFNSMVNTSVNTLKSQAQAESTMDNAAVAVLDEGSPPERVGLPKIATFA